MRISNGIASGMVLQRNPENNLCDVYVQLDCKGEPIVSQGTLLPQKDGWYNLCGIPCGGPYKLIISDDVGSVELTDIYVGDVWLLAGQSNMEGAGIMTEIEDAYEKNPQKDVRAFYLDDQWDVARAQLHQQWKNADCAIAEHFINIRANSAWQEGIPRGPQRDGVCPGLSVGLSMKEYMGVPQGLIACAFGGSSLSEWAPDNQEARAYYPTLIRRARACGGKVRGLFWYQGESEASLQGVPEYERRMVELIAAIRKDLDSPCLPIVLFQLQSNCLPGASEEINGKCWGMIREIQRTLPEKIEHTDVVATIDLDRDDRIHLSAASAHIVGQRGARAMYALCAGKVLPAPKLKSITIEQDPVAFFRGNLIIQYDNIIGPLSAKGNVMGFSVTMDERQAYKEPHQNILRVCLDGDKVCVRTRLSCEELKEAYIWYGAGLNSVCTIIDSDNMSLPAMGPIPIKEYIIQ